MGVVQPPALIPESQSERDDQDSDKGLSKTFFWVGVATTGVFGASTIALEIGVRAKWKDSQADPENQSLKQDVKTLQALGITALCITGAAAVTTAVLIPFTDFSRGERDDGQNPEMAFAPVITGSGGGIAVQGRF